MEEMKTLLTAYQKELGEPPQLLAVALSARKNMCIHPEVGVAKRVWQGVYLASICCCCYHCEACKPLSMFI